MTTNDERRTTNDETKMTSTTATSSKTTSTTDLNHTPGIKLTDKERAKKAVDHNYGLCCGCDTGFDRLTEFIYYWHPSGVYALCMCVACNRYYADTGTVFDFDNF